MPDTKRRAYTDQSLACSDCGEKGVDWSHKGNLLPEESQESPDEWKDFCAFCYSQRQDRQKRGEQPLPLGVKPPGVSKEFFGKSIKVETESGSIYNFGVPNKKSVRTVSNTERRLNFTECKVFLATVGATMWIRVVNDPEKDSSHLAETTPVKSIEVLS